MILGVFVLSLREGVIRHGGEAYIGGELIISLQIRNAGYGNPTPCDVLFVRDVVICHQEDGGMGMRTVYVDHSFSSFIELQLHGTLPAAAGEYQIVHQNTGA